MGPLGWQETIFILVLALLVFGPKKLPELGKTLGKVMTEFRRATNDFKGTWDREMQAMERDSGVREATRQIDGEIAAASVDQTYHGTSSSYDAGYDYGYGYDPEAPATGTSASQEIAASTDVAALPESTTASAETPYVPDTIAREKPVFTETVAAEKDDTARG